MHYHLNLRTLNVVLLFGLGPFFSRQCFSRYLVHGLVTFGRQGLFAHNNAHHPLYMAYAAADCLDVENRFDDARWGNSRRIFETHVVED
jgi:hypothetical protein